jgi:hypothetical protein
MNEGKIAAYRTVTFRVVAQRDKKAFAAAAGNVPYFR